jgi:DNA-binding CsgD family transcriptional regulator
VDRLKEFAVFDDSSDPVVAFSDDGAYLYANSAALKLFEVSDILGRTVGEFATEQPERQNGDACATFRGAADRSGETQIRTAGGRLTRVRYRSTPYYAGDAHLSIMRIATSNGRESARAELFHSVFENAPDALLLADDDRRCFDGNRATRKLLGLSRDALTALRIDDLTAAPARPSLPGIWATFLENGSMHGHYPLLLGNGLERTVLFRAKANVSPGRHLAMFQPARPGTETTRIELGRRQRGEELTSREREVLTLLARGASARTIAEARTLSPDTIRTHVRNAMKKLGARSRPEAVALAMKQRQIDP